MENSEESTIDVQYLSDVLYQTYANSMQRNSHSDLPDCHRFINDCGIKLKEALLKKKLNGFLEQLGPLFRPQEDMQKQMLISDFIKDALEPSDLPMFIDYVRNVSKEILDQKMKSEIISVLQ